jgi:hypothetical protein
MHPNSDEPSALIRYFLRRLAIARRNGYTPSASYSDAKAETILVFIAAPTGAVLSFILLGSLRWVSQATAAQHPLPGKLVIALVFTAVSLVVGHFLLDGRLKKYRNNPSSSLNFDTERDRGIVFWQKFVVLVSCGIIIPWLGIAVAFVGRK